MKWLRPTVVTAVVLIATVWLLNEYRVYLAAPSVRNQVWDRAAQQIRKGWDSQDDLAFEPSWISGYVLDRRRLRGLSSSSDAVRNVFNADADRNVWLVSLFASQRFVDRVDQDFVAIETYQFGDVRVQKLRRK